MRDLVLLLLLLVVVFVLLLGNGVGRLVLESDKDGHCASDTSETGGRTRVESGESAVVVGSGGVGGHVRVASLDRAGEARHCARLRRRVGDRCDARHLVQQAGHLGSGGWDLTRERRVAVLVVRRGDERVDPSRDRRDKVRVLERVQLLLIKVVAVHDLAEGRLNWSPQKKETKYR